MNRMGLVKKKMVQVSPKLILLSWLLSELKISP